MLESSLQSSFMRLALDMLLVDFWASFGEKSTASHSIDHGKSYNLLILL